MNSTIPTYDLYGETLGKLLPEALHCESIPQRSRLHQWEILPHRHDAFMQILHIEQGGAEVMFDHIHTKVEGPHALIVPALQIHGFQFSSSIQGSVFTIVEHHLRQLMSSQDPPFAYPAIVPLDDSPNDRAFTQAAHALLDEFTAPRPGRLPLLQSYLIQMTVHLQRKMSENPHLHSASPVRRGERHLQRFYRLLASHFRTQHQLAFYAQHLGITTTQLNRICREHKETTALGLINQKLLTEACRDLAYTYLSIKEIALNLGFSDPSYFSRFFSKHLGQSPSEFREHAAQNFTTRSAPPAPEFLGRKPRAS